MKNPDARYRDAGAMLTALSAIRPVRTHRLPSQSPFSSPAVDDSVGGTVARVNPDKAGRHELPTRSSDTPSSNQTP